MSRNLLTWRIQFFGLVQGVGFRPFVYNSASKFELNGWVKNDKNGVHIEVNCNEKIAREFFSFLKDSAPQLSVITNSSIEKSTYKKYDSFEIIHGTEKGQPILALTPDYAICEQCSSELEEQDDRRYSYPFITCCTCGPRYSIINQLPFERAFTVMDRFKMCEQCAAEYDNAKDRRFYAQTISCDSCGIRLQLYNTQKQILEKKNSEIVRTIREAWDSGKIVAIKGIGGYLLTCDAANHEAIKNLRRKKSRPDKPLALMVPNKAFLQRFPMSEQEVNAINSPAAPIVLLKIPNDYEPVSGICDGLSRIGVMLPYAPLFQLLMKGMDQPIVATSGNLSNQPIVFKDDSALKKLLPTCDLLLTNDREIVVPQDDSVIVYTKIFKKKIILRRSRGLSPSYINSKLSCSIDNVLAMGAFLKSTFSLLQNGEQYISQYLGDLNNYESEENYKYCINHLRQLLLFNPELVVVDLHQDFPSTQLGRLISEREKVPLLKVQHHIAHFSALIGEHNLIHEDEGVLGIVWDGNGYGTDQQICRCA